MYANYHIGPIDPIAITDFTHKYNIHQIKQISEKILSWTRVFLLGREQLVTVNGEISRVAEVLSGIPQGTEGSVLGPLLFICFVNDMPNVVHSHIQMFADDTKLYCEVNNMQNAHDLQKDLQPWRLGQQLGN